MDGIRMQITYPISFVYGGNILDVCDTTEWEGS
jgi:hypothetical protein